MIDSRILNQEKYNTKGCCKYSCFFKSFLELKAVLYSVQVQVLQSSQNRLGFYPLDK